jgi:hypothetical protein
MKANKKRIHIFWGLFFCSLFLNIIAAKLNLLYNIAWEPYKIPNMKIVAWDEVFQEWKDILVHSTIYILMGYAFYFIFKEKNTAANNAEKNKK